MSRTRVILGRYVAAMRTLCVRYAISVRAILLWPVTCMCVRVYVYIYMYPLAPIDAISRDLARLARAFRRRRGWKIARTRYVPRREALGSRGKTDNYPVRGRAAGYRGEETEACRVTRNVNTLET